MRKQQVVVVGAAKSGVAAANLLIRLGASVTLVDEKPRAALTHEVHDLNSRVRFHGAQTHFASSAVDLIVVSPGVPWDHPELRKARKMNIPVWPELELGWRFSVPRCTVAVTGTNGKTTTTALIAHILGHAGLPVVMGGNIGTPLSALTKRITTKTYLVLEVSSYQLEGHATLHPNVAVFLNLTPDHLKRHKTLARYAAAKGRLFTNMVETDVAVLNGEDRWCRAAARKIRSQKIIFPNPQDQKLSTSIKLPGRHNLENAMAAAAACRAVGLSDAAIRAGMASFKGVPHRLEFIRDLKGVRYFNDSKATNVDSTAVALKSFSNPLVLIMGGEHKGSSYRPLRALVSKHVRVLLTIGEAAPLIEKDLKNVVPIYRCKQLTAAVKRAGELAKKGDVVLLSPACASFDQFKNFEHRGEDFRRLVRALR